MKLIILGFVILTSSFTSCNSNNPDNSKNKLDSNSGNFTNQTNQVAQKDSASIERVLTVYLKVKNALVAGKPKEAAEAGKSLKNALDSLGAEPMTEAQQKAFENRRRQNELKEQSSENAEMATADDATKN